ncbi:MAG TPA: CHAT domain-containing protein [Streptosporangiaceae bacterium]|nr:CHAT domain-containing protein [Streptosporangiaceae bacterium]
MKRDKALAAVNDRVARYLESHDPQLILDPEGLREAAELMPLAADDLELAYALGMLHHFRLEALTRAASPDSGNPDARAALGFFTQVYRVAPDAIPEPLREVLAATLTPAESDLANWNARATALLRDPQVRTDPAAIDDAISLLRLVVAASTDDRARAGYLSNLGLALRVRFGRSGNVADLDEAISAGQQAADAVSAGDPDPGRYFSNAAISLMERFEHRGEMADLDAALRSFRRSAGQTAEGHPSRAGRLSNLGAAEASKFEYTGELADLDRAIEALRQAVDVAADPAERAGYESNLCGALTLRFRHIGELSDINEAVGLAQRAEAAMPAGHQERIEALSALGLALRIRHERLRQPGDLDEAISAFRKAADSAAAGHRRRASCLSNLGTAYRIRFETTADAADAADADAAVSAGQEAVQISAPGHPSRPRYLSNLGAALSARYRHTQSLADLDAAIDAERQAAEAIPGDNPLRATVLANLGLALRQRAARGGGDRDLSAAAEAYQLSARTESAPPLVRATSAHEWGTAAMERHDWLSAVAGFQTAVQLLPQLATRRLAPGDQHHHLGRLGGLGCDAAAAALNAGNAPQALALLEHGRGVLLAQALETRSDTTLLRDHAPALAGRFEDLRQQLNEPLQGDEPAPGEGAGTVRRRHRLAAEWARLLSEIRAQPGLGRFLEPPAPADLVALAGADPVVAVNVSAYRCDALIVTSEGIRPVPLPALTYGDALKNANDLLRAVHQLGPGADSVIEPVLTWLWDTVAGPVLRELGITPARGSAEPLRRLWWMPTGPLAVLPLHAAGYHGKAGSRRTVLDSVISSYTPTIRALSHARRPRPPGSPRKALVVAVPDAPGEPGLVRAIAEARQVAGYLGDGTQTLIGAQATRFRVLAELRRSTWVHVASHATTDAGNPSEGHLVLHDGPLRIREIPVHEAGPAELAYLSACTTAFAGTELVDEAMHIASAFQLAGYAHVIGTLWPVSDRAAARLAAAMYAALLTPGGHRDPARALHDAVLAFRVRHPDAPSAWAAHGAQRGMSGTAGQTWRARFGLAVMAFRSDIH